MKLTFVTQRLADHRHSWHPRWDVTDGQGAEYERRRN
jgi:hypothetical protein